jgi:hypothetical protein
LKEILDLGIKKELMIIHGHKGKIKEISSGHFFCSFCESIRDYKRFRVTRNFTLYYISLFPIKKLGEYIECQGCFTPFEPEILIHQQPKIKEYFSKEELFILWKEIYESLDCDKYIGTTLDSPLMRTTIFNMKGAGANLGAGDYQSARESLKYLLLCCEEWMKVRDEIESEMEKDRY